MARQKRAKGSRGRRKASNREQMKEQMLSIIMRKRKETLAQACKRVGITPTSFYVRLKTATFGSLRRGRERKVSLSSTDAKRLAALIQRQSKLQAALTELRKKFF